MQKRTRRAREQFQRFTRSLFPLRISPDPGKQISAVHYVFRLWQLYNLANRG